MIVLFVWSVIVFIITGGSRPPDFQIESAYHIREDYSDRRCQPAKDFRPPLSYGRESSAEVDERRFIPLDLKMSIDLSRM